MGRSLIGSQRKFFKVQQCGEELFIILPDPDLFFFIPISFLGCVIPGWTETPRFPSSLREEKLHKWLKFCIGNRK